ncbi:chemosensory receptor a [Plakobranchus ocellatus]|uniref:Chemosensory receptor a n=1 Tax=Plakobranchus ocellatus TaxID=259542 RepID=A0AAV4A534_9GAST|nr:chemosensory receptor a [Plakobranchus ocellatus]
MLRNNSFAGDALKEDITSEATLWVATIVLKFCTTTFLALCSMVSNIVNIVVFCKMGFDGSLTQNFLGLSIADCLYGCIWFILSIGLIVNRFGVWRSTLSLQAFFKLGSAICSIPFFASIICTTVIAVVRCCSVVMPFHVKAIVTPRRQALAIIVLVSIQVAFSSYVYSCLQLDWQSNARNNISYITLGVCDSFFMRQRILDYYRSIFIYTSLIIINVCLCILIVTLRRSANFKKITSSGEPKTLRELQVIKTVTLVSAIFVLCNTPGLCLALLRQTLSDFKLNGYMSRTFEILFMFHNASTLVNSSVNIFVFYFSSSNYRKSFKGLLGRMK